MAKYDQQWYSNFYGRYLGAFVMIVLVITNVIFYACQMIFGSALTYSGALITDNVYNEGEWYRLLSATFLHADISHLLSNMLGLFFLGGLVEISVGHLGFFFIYVLSGVGGNALSMLYENIANIDRYSLGASGGVYGLVGAILVLSINERIKAQKEGRPAGNLLYRGLFVVVFMVLAGLSEQGINNSAHIGGLVIGIIVCSIIVLLLGKRVKAMDI